MWRVAIFDMDTGCLQHGRPDVLPLIQSVDKVGFVLDGVRIFRGMARLQRETHIYGKYKLTLAATSVDMRGHAPSREQCQK